MEFFKELYRSSPYNGCDADGHHRSHVTQRGENTGPDPARCCGDAESSGNPRPKGGGRSPESPGSRGARSGRGSCVGSTSSTCAVTPQLSPHKQPGPRSQRSGIPGAAGTSLRRRPAVGFSGVSKTIRFKKEITESLVFLKAQLMYIHTYIFHIYKLRQKAITVIRVPALPLQTICTEGWGHPARPLAQPPGDGDGATVPRSRWRAALPGLSCRSDFGPLQVSEGKKLMSGRDRFLSHLSSGAGLGRRRHRSSSVCHPSPKQTLHN